MSAVSPVEGGSGSTDAVGRPDDGHDDLSDRQLLEVLRGGDRSVTAELFRRHHDAASRLARQLVRSRSDVDDIVSDAFTRVFKAIDNGRGPTDNFRGYLYTAVRSSACRRHSESKRLVLSAQTQTVVDFDASTDPVLETFDRTAAGRAYISLPQRWQTVLWLVDVEERPATEVAKILGMTPNAVAALSYRAREGLRQGFLSAHSREHDSTDVACEPIRPLLSPYVRHRTSARDTLRVDRHLEGCADCRELLEELRTVNTTILHGIAPLLIPVGAIATLRAAPTWLAGSTGTAGTAAGAGTGVVGVSMKSAPKVLAAFKVPTVVAGGVGALAAAAVAAVVLLGPAADPGPAGEERSLEAPPANTVVLSDPGMSPPPAPAAEVESGTTAPGSGAAASGAPDDTTTTTTPGTTPSTTPADPTPGVSTPVPTDPVGVLTVSQVGPLSPGGDGGVVVEAAELPDGSPVRLAWNLPDGVVVHSARSDRASCDDAGCDLDTSSDAPVSVALTVSSNAASADVAAAAGVASADDALTFRLSDSSESYLGVETSLPLTLAESRYRTSFVDVGRLALEATGNSVLTCDRTQSGCAVASDRNGDRQSNDLWQLVMVDTDGDPGTYNSSSAGLDIPAGARITRAELIWGGQLDPAPPAGIDPSLVRLTTSSGTVAVAADTLSRGADGSYQSSADVTSLIEGAALDGGTVVAVANVAVSPRPGAWGGWGLAVVVEHPELPRRAVVLAHALDPGDGRLDLLPGATGRLDEVLALQWDGDPDHGPDWIDVIGGPVAALRISGADNPGDDIANSSVAIRGVRPPGAAANTFGVDIDLLRVADVARPGLGLQTSLGTERRFVGLLGASIDLG